MVHRFALARTFLAMEKAQIDRKPPLTVGRFVTALAAAALFCLTNNTHAATTTVTFQQGVGGYVGTQDTTLRDDATGQTPQGNTGELTADGAGPAAHTLLRFDNMFGTGVGQIPPGATITSAILRLQTTDNGNRCWGHRALVTWDEATATWNSMVAGVTVATGELADAPDFNF